MPLANRKIPFQKLGLTDYDALAVVQSPGLWQNAKQSDLILEYYDVQLDANGDPVKAADGVNLKSDYLVKRFTIPGNLLRAALVQATGDSQYWDTVADADVANRPTAADVAAAGITVTAADANGERFLMVNLADNDTWTTNAANTEKYLVGYQQKFLSVNGNLTSAKKAYVDVYGVPTNRALMQVGSVFSSNYSTRSWNTWAQDDGFLSGVPFPADGTPSVQALADLNASQKNPSATYDPAKGFETQNKWGVKKASQLGTNSETRFNTAVPQQDAYYDYDSAYRVYNMNNTKFALKDGGTMTIGPVNMEAVQDERNSLLADSVWKDPSALASIPYTLIGFQTEKLNIMAPAYIRDGYSKTTGDNAPVLTTKTDASGNDYKVTSHAGTVKNAYVEFFPMTYNNLSDVPTLNKSTLPPLYANNAAALQKLDITDLFEYLYGYEIGDDGKLDTTKPVTAMPAWADAVVTDDEGNQVTDESGNPLKVVTVDADGNVSIDWSAWGEGYLSRVVVEYSDYSNWLSRETGGYIELLGRTTNHDVNRVDAKFKTTSRIEDWTRSWTSSVSLNSKFAPMRPATNIGSYGSEDGATAPNDTTSVTRSTVSHVNYDTLDVKSAKLDEDMATGATYWSQYPCTPQELRETMDTYNVGGVSGHGEAAVAYRNEENAGYRAWLTNDSDYPVSSGALFTIGELKPRWDKQSFSDGTQPGRALKQNMGFHINDITLSKNFLAKSDIAAIVVKYMPVTYDANGTAQHSQVTLNNGAFLTTGLSTKVIPWEAVEEANPALAGKNADVTLKPSDIILDLDSDGNVYRPLTTNDVDIYFIEFRMNSLPTVTQADEAYVDLFGYAIDSCNVSNATDPFYGESEDTWPEKDEWDLAHYGTTHSWGCPGAGRDTDKHYLGYKAYVSNYYDVVELTSKLQVLLPKREWSEGKVNGVANGSATTNGGGEIADPAYNWWDASKQKWRRGTRNQAGASPQGECVSSEDKANLYTIAGKPTALIGAAAYFDPEHTAAESVANTAPANMADGAKAFWGEDGAAYRFSIGNAGRLMFESELRIGTTTTKGFSYVDGSYDKSHPLSGASLSYDKLPDNLSPDEEVELYENAMRGFQTKNIMLSADLVNNTALSYIDVYYFPRDVDSSQLTYLYATDKNATDSSTGNKLLQTKRIDKATLFGYQQANGSIVVPWDEWGQGYLTNAVVRFDRVEIGAGVSAGTTLSNTAYVDVWGQANNVRDMPLNAWFGCTYPEEGYHYTKNEPSRPYGTNMMNYQWKTWCNWWQGGTSNYGGRQWTSGYTRVGDFVKYVSNGATEANKKLPESSYNAALMPQFKREVANWEDMWVGGATADAGTVNAWIYGRPYNVNEGIAAETYMRSDGPAATTGYGATAGNASQDSALALSTNTRGYYEEDGSGFRFTLTNQNNNAITQLPMRKAYFATEPLPFAEKMQRKHVDATDTDAEDIVLQQKTDASGNPVTDAAGNPVMQLVSNGVVTDVPAEGETVETKELERAGEYVNFTTTDVVLSKTLLEQSMVDANNDGTPERTNIKDFIIYFRPYDETITTAQFGAWMTNIANDQSITLRPEELFAVYTGTTTRTVTWTDPADETNTVSTSIPAWAYDVTFDEAGVPSYTVSDYMQDPVAKNGGLEMHNCMPGATDEEGNAIQQKATVYKDADGNIVVNRAAWGGHFFRNVEMHLNYFKGGITKDADISKNAFVEFYGYGSNRWVDYSMSATFRTDWATDWWNVNNTASNLPYRYDNGYYSGSYWHTRWVETGPLRLNYDYSKNASNGSSTNYRSYSRYGNVAYKNFDNYDANGNVINLRPFYWANNGSWYTVYRDASGQSDYTLESRYSGTYETYNTYSNLRGGYWQTGWNTGYTTDSRGEIVSSALATDPARGEDSAFYYKPTKANYNDASAQPVGTNASYTALATATLNIALQPVRPKVEMFSYKDYADANAAINLTNVNSNGTVYDTPTIDRESARPERTNVVDTRNATWNSQPRAYFGDESVGYRAFLTNNSTYAMNNGARVAIGNTEEVLDSGNSPADMRPVTQADAPGLLGNLGFHTSMLTLSGGLYAAGQKKDADSGAYASTIEGITLYWYDAGAKAKATQGTTNVNPLPLATTDGLNGSLLAADGSFTVADRTMHKRVLTPEEVADLFKANGTDAQGRPQFKDALLDPSFWNNGDLCGILIDYGYFTDGLAERSAYVDFHGYTTDSPDVTKRTNVNDTWCYNEGWEGNDGPSVVQSWDWKYVKVQLAADFRTDYDMPEWNHLHGYGGYYTYPSSGGSVWHSTYVGHSTGAANGHGEFTRSTDFGNIYAHMPASSQKVRAKSYFIDSGAANAMPLYSLNSGDLTNKANLRTMTAGDMADSTTAWYGYYGSGWRFTYTNYANPTTIFSNNTYSIAGPTYGYTGGDKSVWNRDANVYDRDYEMFDSYISLAPITSQVVPANEKDDYQNDLRDYDAKYLRLSKGLLDAMTWTDRPSWAADRVIGEGRGNALKTIAITANVPESRRPAIPEGTDEDPLPEGTTVTVETEGANTVTTVTTPTGITVTRTVTATGAYVSNTFIYTLAQIEAMQAAGSTDEGAEDAGYDAAGNLVLPNTLWNKGYFTGARIDMSHFNAGVHEADEAFVDVLGGVDVSQTTIELTSTFTTCYDTNTFAPYKTAADFNDADGNAVGTWDHTSDAYGLWDAERNNRGAWGSGSSSDNTVLGTRNSYGSYTNDTAWQAARDLNGNRPIDRNDGLDIRSNGMDISDRARLVSRIDPAKPQVEAQTFLYAEEAGELNSDMMFSSDVRDASGAKTGENFARETASGNHGIDPAYVLETLMGSTNAGWRFTLFNNSNYAMDSSRVVIGGTQNGLSLNGTQSWQSYTGTNDYYNYASTGSTQGMFDGDKGTIGTWTDQNRIHNYDGGQAIYGELVDGTWRGFEIDELFMNDQAGQRHAGPEDRRVAGRAGGHRPVHRHGTPTRPTALRARRTTAMPPPTTPV